MSSPTDGQKVAVYCGSSGKCDARYLDEAARTGTLLAQAGLGIVFGGGSTGLMGSVADAALSVGGAVIGVMPRFMVDVEWAHAGLTDLRTVDSMHQRKQLILDTSDAVVALPGGCGTLEELLEAITWKQLGLLTGPIVVVNYLGFYDLCLTMLESCIRERFMNPHHRDIWSVISSADGILACLTDSPKWSEDALLRAPVE